MHELERCGLVANENSHANIIGKKIGIFPDMRLKPGKMYGTNYDPGGLDHKSASLMLQITGRDLVRVGRKYDPEGWEGFPRMKIVIVSNEIPNLQDASGVLPTRFIKIWFGQNFRGREDRQLRSKLSGELPGIAVRCLAAYRRLRQRGEFIQPKASLEFEQEILETSDPVAAFINECCVVRDGESVKFSRVFDRFNSWCQETGRKNILFSIKKSHQLSAALRRVLKTRINVVRPGGETSGDIVGLRLKTGKDLFRKAPDRPGKG
jgi:putative DNA primase/helicase